MVISDTDSFTDDRPQFNWFGYEWMGKIVEFGNPDCSWKIVDRFREHVDRCYQEMGDCSESTCVFVCENTTDSTKAILKTSMQFVCSGLLAFGFFFFDSTNCRYIYVGSPFSTRRSNPPSSELHKL